MAVVAVGQMLVSIAQTNIVSQQMFYTDPYTDRVIVNPDWANQAGNLVLASFGMLILGVVASWLFNAIAISGLRGRPLAVGWIVERGLLSVLNGLLVGICAIVAVIVSFIVFAVAARALGGAAILLWIAWLFGLLYLAARFAFTGLSIFDGHGPVEAISESWSLSEKSVLRLVGWGLFAILISLAFTIAGAIVSSPFGSSGARAIGRLLSALITTTGSCTIVFFLAVLYESQRARRDINRAGQPAHAAPYGGYGPGQYPAAPGAYPPAPGQYPPAPGQWPAAPYGSQTPGQWPQAPQVPGQYPATPTPWPQVPQVPGQYPAAPTPWPPAPPAGAYPPAPAVWQSAPPAGSFPQAPTSAPASVQGAETELPPTPPDRSGEPGPGGVS